MRIALLNTVGKSISGGYKRYLKEIIPRLLASEELTSLLCAIPKGLISSEWNTYESKFELFEYNTTCFSIIEIKRILKQKIDKFAPDVVFFPIERYIKFRNIPVVNMIQNMEPLVYNDIENPPLEVVKNYIRRHLCRQAMRSSDRVIAISNFVREFVISEFNIPPENVGLVYLGSNKTPESVELKPTLPSYLSNNPYIFTAGTIRPARGLEDLIITTDALKKDSNHSHLSLIIAGETLPMMQNYRKKLQTRLNPVTPPYIWWAGQLGEKEMLWCYKNSSLFVMTSRVEACPNIAIEAMNAGCLCISTKNPPMPEIFGDSAFYYNAGDAKELTGIIIDTLKLNNEEKANMREKAQKRASQFSWDITALNTLRELRNAKENKKRIFPY